MRLKRNARDECALLVVYLFKYADELLQLLPSERKRHYLDAIKTAPDLYDSPELFNIFKQIEDETWEKRPSDLEITVNDFIDLLREYKCLES
jgi:hypothetical protein